MTPARARLLPALIAAVLAFVALTSCSGSSSSNSPSGSSASAAASPAGPAVALQQAYIDVVRRASPSVVQVRTPAGLGSGVVFDQQGDIVTNNHVVGSSKSFQVYLADSSVAHQARLIGTYPPGDIAVIRVADGGTLHPARFASSNPPVGAIVLAMGSPLGLSGSVSNGIVSAVGRTVTEPGEDQLPATTLPSVIQTTAAINPGNSGGALVSLDGDVAGIPTLAAIDPAQGGSAGSVAPGIGFAIPGRVAADLAGQLVRSGHVTDSHRAALGVEVTGLVNASGDPVGVGVISVRPGGAAAAAGVRAGDVITDLAGKPTPSPSALSEVLAGLSVGQRVPLTVQAPGAEPRHLQITLGQLGS